MGDGIGHVAVARSGPASCSARHPHGPRWRRHHRARDRVPPLPRRRPATSRWRWSSRRHRAGVVLAAAPPQHEPAALPVRIHPHRHRQRRVDGDRSVRCRRHHRVHRWACSRSCSTRTRHGWPASLAGTQRDARGADRGDRGGDAHVGSCSSPRSWCSLSHQPPRPVVPRHALGAVRSAYRRCWGCSPPGSGRCRRRCHRAGLAALFAGVDRAGARRAGAQANSVLAGPHWTRRSSSGASPPTSVTSAGWRTS